MCQHRMLQKYRCYQFILGLCVSQDFVYQVVKGQDFPGEPGVSQYWMLHRFKDLRDVWDIRMILGQFGQESGFGLPFAGDSCLERPSGQFLWASLPLRHLVLGSLFAAVLSRNQLSMMPKSEQEGREACKLSDCHRRDFIKLTFLMTEHWTNSFKRNLYFSKADVLTSEVQRSLGTVTSCHVQGQAAFFCES